MKSSLTFVFASLLILISSFAHSQTLAISGSTTGYPLVSKAAKAFMNKNKKLEIIVSSTGSGKGIEQLVNGQVDLAVSSRYLFEDEIHKSAANGVHLVPFQIAYDYVIPIVHPGNPIKDISEKQLRQIYSGEISNWQSVGGNNKEIKVISREKTSGTYSLWDTKILAGNIIVNTAKYVNSNYDIVKEVSRDPSAIGYIGHGFLNMYVKPLSVNGIYGSPKAAINSKYLLNRTIFLFSRGWPEGKTMGFINFIQNPKTGQKLTKESGLVSVY